MEGNSTGAAITGAVLLVAGLVGGGVSIAGISFPVVGFWPVQVMVIVIGAALLNFNTQWPMAAIAVLGLACLAVVGWGAVAGVTSDGTEGNGGTDGQVASPGGGNGEGTTSDGGGDVDGRGSDPGAQCTVVVSNPLAVIREEPDTFAQEITDVPAGTYDVRNVTEVPVVDTDQRWLLIDVEGTRGWIRDTTFNIDSRSGCDF